MQMQMLCMCFKGCGRTEGGPRAACAFAISRCGGGRGFDSPLSPFCGFVVLWFCGFPSFPFSLFPSFPPSLLPSFPPFLLLFFPPFFPPSLLYPFSFPSFLLLSFFSPPASLQLPSSGLLSPRSLFGVFVGVGVAGLVVVVLSVCFVGVVRPCLCFVASGLVMVLSVSLRECLRCVFPFWFGGA